MEVDRKNIKIKEYPPLIPVKIIIEDQLVGAKSYRTVIKRLKTIGVRILAFDMVFTQDLFSALLPNKKKATKQVSRRSKPFKLR